MRIRNKNTRKFFFNGFVIITILFLGYPISLNLLGKTVNAKIVGWQSKNEAYLAYNVSGKNYKIIQKMYKNRKELNNKKHIELVYLTNNPEEATINQFIYLYLERLMYLGLSFFGWSILYTAFSHIFDKKNLINDLYKDKT